MARKRPTTKSSRVTKTRKKPAAATPAKAVAPAAPAAPPGKVPALKAPPRPSIENVTISPDSRVKLYAQSRYLSKALRDKLGLTIPFTTYFQDPFVARTDPKKAFDEKVLVAWEPGLADGPTSSRFAVVDYNGDTGTLEPPAVWDLTNEKYLGTDGKPVDKKSAEAPQFHQVSVWALLQCALDYFEDASALGRRIPWAFEGNRLIVVPHAGYGENAYYDRASKSLQFYYFDGDEGTVYTCLSADIVHHEFGHAVLDGIRPLFNETINLQTAAFHEAIGDITAILLTLKNKKLRQQLAAASGGKFDKATTLSSLAEEFGNAVNGRPYLRTAANQDKMSAMKNETGPHRLSGVLTGAMFDALIQIGEIYKKTEDPSGEPREAKSNAEVFWLAADRMQRTAIQPLDLLPPADVTFRDYALAVCRSQELSDPLDPEGYRDMLIDVFLGREILTQEDVDALKTPHYLYDRLRLSVAHSIDDISRSRASAYRYLDDNREDLLIPAKRDFFVADLYDVKKRFRQNLMLPRQIILQYVWREEILLEGTRFGRYEGRTTTMLCGGTLVFNENGNVLSWMKKPGSEPYGAKWYSRGAKEDAWNAAVADGQARRGAILDQIAAQVASGRVGAVLGSPRGLMASMMPPMTVEEDGDVVRFQLSPHLHLSEDKHLAAEAETGERQWQISC